MCVVVVVLKKKNKPLPRGVPPANRHSGANMFPVEEKSSRYRASHQSQDPDVSFGGKDSRETACHFVSSLFLGFFVFFLLKEKSLFFTATGKEGQVNGSVGNEVPLMEWKGVRLRSSDIKMEEYTTRAEIQLHLQNKSTRLKRLMFFLQMRTHNLHRQM